ncbi:MAG: restriction endonuclease subunit S [Clostridiaceae bacterium]|nr:restriction endonuclease subunit S [Clostridiaceae bacterium]
MKAQQLRNAVLQLAIQGKLVPQDPSDEPARVLLEKIKAEKEQQIKDRKIKPEKPLPEITDEEKSFEIPNSWEWVRLGEISTNIHYGFNASAQISGNAKLLRITDIQDNKVMWSNVPFCHITDKEYDTYGLNNRDIMIARTGGTIGKTYIVENLSYKSVFASYLIRVIPPMGINEKYLKLYLESPFYWEQLKEKSMGTGQPNVNGSSLKKLIIVLPPLTEQQRIVSKIEEIMPLIEHYEKLETELFKLEAGFPKSLKKSILLYAVQGKLVEQNKDDEPVSILIEKIKAEKEQLIKDKKIKREKPLLEIMDEEKFFDIPDGWEWVRLGDVVQINPRNKVDDDLDVSFIPMPLIADGYKNIHTSDIRKWKEVKSGFTHFQENDVAIAKITPCFENRKSVVLCNLYNGYGAKLLKNQANFV